MTKKLIVNNFKSIKHLELDCKKVNIFIGKPNTGKSNILESVGIFSLPYGNIKNFVRFQNMTDLFYDHALSEKPEVSIDSNTVCEIKFNGNVFNIVGQGQEFNFNVEANYQGEHGPRFISGMPPFKSYKFTEIDTFPVKQDTFLRPPAGENLLLILQTNKELKKTAENLFDEYGLKLMFVPEESKIKIGKLIDNTIISYPYTLVSDTLQRIIFHLAAIETNQKSVIVLEEPESHSFPYYTTFLAERIALDKTNQYFIATHNPYFLLSILEKTPKDDLGIFITYFEGYQTKVKSIKKEDMADIYDLGADVFINVDKFLGK